ncbi:MAG TPA: SRPBCC domain-containing protein [Ruania sp.]|nr:SRPBCC domain-containing protein [Ruania sp.]
MFDQDAELAAVTRHVRRDPLTVTVLLRRDLRAAHDEVWDALTDREQLSRWFALVAGEFRKGGKYQIGDSISGEIWECRPREHFMLTFDGPESLLTVELAYAGDFTTVQLTHGVPISDAGSGAEALVVGPRWDAALVSLSCYLAGEALEGPVASTHNQEVLDLTRASIDRWEQVVTESATATTEEISAAQEAALEQLAAHR